MRGRLLDRRRVLRARLILAVMAVAALAVLIAGAYTLVATRSQHSSQAEATQPASAQPTPSAHRNQTPPVQMAPVPALLRDRLVRFLAAFYTRKPGETDAERAMRIEGLVTPATWSGLTTLVPGMPTESTMTCQIQLSRLQSQTPRTPHEVYLVVPVVVTAAGSKPVTYTSASLWSEDSQGSWTLLQFAGAPPGGG